MNRELALKIALAVTGVLFLALAYPTIVFFWPEPALAMMFSLYVTLGVFLLLAIRDPWAQPQPDRVHGFVEVRSRGRDGFAGTAQHRFTRRTGGCGYSYLDRRSIDRTRACKTADRGCLARFSR